MSKQFVPVIAIGIALSACASIQAPPAQTASVEEPNYPSNSDSDSITDRDVPYAAVTHVYWFFGDR